MIGVLVFYLLFILFYLFLSSYPEPLLYFYFTFKKPGNLLFQTVTK